MTTTQWSSEWASTHCIYPFKIFLSDTNVEFINIYHIRNMSPWDSIGLYHITIQKHTSYLDGSFYDTQILQLLQENADMNITVSFMTPSWLCKLLCNLWALRLWDKYYIIDHTGIAMITPSSATMRFKQQNSGKINSHRIKIVCTFLLEYLYFYIPEKFQMKMGRHCGSIKNCFYFDPCGFLI